MFVFERPFVTFPDGWRSENCIYEAETRIWQLARNVR
jgi:hypothetical protein